MTEAFEFGAYIPRSLLDEMSHAEAYISARVLFWLSKKEEIYKTDKELAEECKVSIRSLQAWKKKVKENHPLGLDFYIKEKPYKRTFYKKETIRKNCGSITQILQEDTANSSVSYIEHKTLHKPPISPKGTFQFEFTEDALRQLLVLTFGESTYASWFQSTPISWDEEQRILFLHPTSSFRKSRLESIVLMSHSGSNVLQKYNTKIEIKI